MKLKLSFNLIVGVILIITLGVFSTAIISNITEKKVSDKHKHLLDQTNTTIDSLQTEISLIRDQRLELQNEIYHQRQRVVYWKERYDSIYEEMQYIDSLSRSLPGDSIARSVILDIRAELR